MSNYILQNKRLKIEINEPGKQYTGTRFDWTGMISQITLDERNVFCVQESLIPGTGTNGRGLFNEFGIEDPIGYDEAEVGQKFPKLGVGLLTKYEEDTYKFFTDYGVEPFEVKIGETEDSITFEGIPKECRGYSVKLVKRISIQENKMKISYKLENVGSKPINTTEYVHNFVAVNNNPIGPDYVLRFSFDVVEDREVELFDIRGKEIGWKREADYEFYMKLLNLPKESGQYWELLHKPSGVAIRETSNFSIDTVAIWGKNHVVSPEAFIHIDVKPGETMFWERDYDFYYV